MSVIIRMSFVSLAGFMFSMACFYLPVNRMFNSIYVPKGVKLKKIQKTLIFSREIQSCSTLDANYRESVLWGLM